MSLYEYDKLDRQIIKLLCKSSQGSYRQIARQLGVHPTTLIQRVKNLESKGVIEGYRASVDYTKLGLNYLGMINIYICSNEIQNIQNRISQIPQVVSILDMTGDSNCTVWVACVDRNEFLNVIRVICSMPGIIKTNTSVVLGIKKDPSLYIPPIDIDV